MRSLLIVAETTLAVVLLVGAGLLTRSFARLLVGRPGVLGRMRCRPSASSLPDGEVRHAAAAAGIHRDAAGAHRRRIRMSSPPAPCSACRSRTSATASRPRTRRRRHAVGRRAGSADPAGARRHAGLLQDDGHSGACGAAASRRPIAWARQPVAMLNQAAAPRVWPDQDAMGHQLELGTRLGLGGARAGGTVVGIVGDVRDHGPAARVAPTLYLAHAQWPVDSMTVVAKARGDPSVAGRADARAAAASSIRTCRCSRVRSMAADLGERRRAAAALPGADRVASPARRCCWRRSVSTACWRTRSASARARSASASPSVRSGARCCAW